MRKLAMLSLGVVASMCPGLLCAAEIDASDPDYLDSQGILNNDFYDDVAALQPGDKVYFPTGTYWIKKPLVLRNLNSGENHASWTSPGAIPSSKKVEIYGDGMGQSIIKLHLQFYTGRDGYRNAYGTSKRVALPVVESKGVVVRDLALHGEGHGTEFVGTTKKGVYAVLFSGCSRCWLQDCEVRDFGAAKKGPSNPTHGQVAVVATELGQQIAPDEFDGFGAPGVECYGNEILGCDFRDEHCIANFGIRIKTDWTLIDPSTNELRAYDTYLAKVKDTKVKDCRFFGKPYVPSLSLIQQGGFNANAIEVGGPATVENTVRDCEFYDTCFAPLECDKGARHNEMKFNLIDRVYPSQASGSRGPGNNVFGMRDAGWETRYSYDNAFRFNDIRNLHGNTFRTGMVILHQSKRVTLYGNTLEANTLVEDGSQPSVIMLKTDVWNAAIKGTKVLDVPAANLRMWFLKEVVAENEQPLTIDIEVDMAVPNANEEQERMVNMRKPEEPSSPNNSGNGMGG